MPRYKLTIEYDGTSYNGWQKQPSQRTIEASLIDAAQQFCGETVEIVGAGRTDAGVHAIAQTAHVDLPKDMDPFRVMQGINYYLFADMENRIAVIHAARVADDFHARFSAKKRHYLYRILNRRARLGLEAGRAWHMIDPLDADAMREAAQLLLGHHDFNSFRDSQCQAKSSLKTLEQLDVKRYGEEIRISAAARSFLHHQMRIMTGTLSMIGKGAWNKNDLLTALEAKNRTAAGPTAPPEGLYLVKVEYS